MLVAGEKRHASAAFVARTSDVLPLRVEGPDALRGEAPGSSKLTLLVIKLKLRTFKLILLTINLKLWTFKSTLPTFELKLRGLQLETPDHQI